MRFTPLIVFIMLFFNCGKTNAQVESRAYNLMLKGLLSHSVNEVNVQEATAAENVVYLDAREKNEYEVSHIENAIWVGYNTFKKKRVAEIDKNSKVIVYCSVGYRSEKISEKLLKMGFTDVSNLYGGIFEWVNQDQVIVDNENQVTNQVHAYDKVWGVWVKKGEKVY